MKIAEELSAKPTTTASIRSTRIYFLSQLIKKTEEQGELTNQALCSSQGVRRRREQSQISSLVSNAAVDKLLLITIKKKIHSALQISPYEDTCNASLQNCSAAGLLSC